MEKVKVNQYENDDFEAKSLSRLSILTILTTPRENLRFFRESVLEPPFSSACIVCAYAHA